MDSNSAKEALESEYAIGLDGTPGSLPFRVIQWGKPVGGDGASFTTQNVIPDDAGGGGDEGAAAIGTSVQPEGTTKEVNGVTYVTRNGQWFPQ
jgi:hypothetical protein